MTRSSLFHIAVLLLLVTRPTFARPSSPADAWVNRQTGSFGDQGDGTYRNPIIAADYSDPDVIRVGSDYYMVASTFASSPGIPILHSYDLVNWQMIGAAFPDTRQLGPNFGWDRMDNYGNGLYAPSIRYHAGKFYVFANCFRDEGLFVSTATDPRGPWTVTQIRDRHGRPLRVGHWTDPCPFWDNDGKAYLFTSRPGHEWYGYLFQMKLDGTQLLDATVEAMAHPEEHHPWPDCGTIYSPFHGTEGNKAYKRGDYYYLVHIEFLPTGHGQGTYILRSKHLYGTKPDGTPGRPGDPGTYEIKKFGLDVPGQGGFVDTPDGRWFWIGQGPLNGLDGRVPNLLPVIWIENWPVPGANIRDGQGQMAWHLPKPIDGMPPTLPVTSDDFSSATLSPCWTWNHEPRNDHWSLTERPGWLRLHAWNPARPGFFGAGNTLYQRAVLSHRSTVTVKLDLTGLADGQEAGLAHFNGGRDYATCGVLQKAGRRSLACTQNGQVTPGPSLPSGVIDLWIRTTYAFDAIARYFYSLDGKTYTAIGPDYLIKSGGWRGDLIGLYTFNSTGDHGYLDVDSYTVTVANRDDDAH